ncbi:MAG: hypothetical protein RLO81_04500 [Fulvivirga sp.]|uniref:hypothetical protein n=1 Tax=Fulvivirga sp. TaxID=1931237 RepID=UPI0032EC439C
MEYPIFLESEEDKVACTHSCEAIESFLKRKGENLKYQELKEFMNSQTYSSKEIECATLQEIYKELARVGLCLNVNLEGSAQYDVTFKMAESMWIIAHVKYVAEYIRDKGETELLDYVASWLKVITEKQISAFSDVEKYI